MLVAGADRGETANLFSKNSNMSATATLGSNHEVASEPHTTLASRPFHGCELTLSPISLVQVLPTHAFRLVVAFARNGDAEGNTIMAEEPSPSLRALCGARTMLQRASLQSPVPNRVVFRSSHFTQRWWARGTSRNGRHPITTKKSPALRKLQPSSKSTSTNEQFRTRFHLT